MGGGKNKKKGGGGGAAGSQPKGQKSKTTDKKADKEKSELDSLPAQLSQKGQKNQKGQPQQQPVQKAKKVKKNKTPGATLAEPASDDDMFPPQDEDLEEEEEEDFTEPMTRLAVKGGGRFGLLGEMEEGVEQTEEKGKEGDALVGSSSTSMEVSGSEGKCNRTQGYEAKNEVMAIQEEKAVGVGREGEVEEQPKAKPMTRKERKQLQKKVPAPFMLIHSQYLGAYNYMVLSCGIL